ncbi:hypothetical protein CRYUN_Cryun18bG0035400 [Craigia yunnanensis]
MYAREHFQAQASDIFLCSPTQTGCTWLKALSFATATRTQYDDSNIPLRTTIPHVCIPFLEYGESSIAAGRKIPLFASYLPYTCLPKSIIDSGEVDLVSVEEAFELFCKGVSSYGPYWEHVLGYWKASLERLGKILFLKYEGMMKDTEGCVKKLAEFFGFPFSLKEERDGIVQRIIKFCNFESLSNLEVNKTGKQVKNDAFVDNSAYFGKGKVGDWRLEKLFEC